MILCYVNVFSGKVDFMIVFLNNNSEYFILFSTSYEGDLSECFLKGIVTQIEKAVINYCLHVSKVSSKFCIPNIYNFAVIYP